ncbi:hypothetical protein BCR44DRAFT_1441581 [Catenaria anguillulae PL171]|uniref:Uncharacterized protein n=1 Tax=Catenaria anguillulae PL171 TaxID=765915 RepID=A0A1Y2HCW9_9FUNG|nr:hypothetical protein BCR44DRAFT_1441581 [Catenaria anguillulae PL171]
MRARMVVEVAEEGGMWSSWACVSAENDDDEEPSRSGITGRSMYHGRLSIGSD